MPDQKVYLDENGEPIAGTPSTSGKVYLDEQGNPITEKPHRRHLQEPAPGFFESLKAVATTPGELFPILRTTANPHIAQTLSNLEMEHAHPGSSLVPIVAGVAPELLPVLGSGSILAGLANLGLRATTAGTAGAGTEAAREQIVEGKIDPARVKSEGWTQGLTQGVGDTIGAVLSSGPTLKKGAVNIVNRFAKPTNELLDRVGKEWGAAPLERAHGLAEGVLQDQVPFSQRGANVLRDRIDANQQKAQDIVANSTARVSTDPPVKNLEAGIDYSKRNLSTPGSTLSAWEEKLAQLQDNPLITKDVRDISVVEGEKKHPALLGGPKRVEVTVTGRKLLPTVPIQISERLKAGDYRRLTDAKYGELQGPEVEASKAIARGWREAGNAVEPGLAPINADTGRAIDLRDYIEGASKRIGQHNILDLLTTAALVGHHPTLAGATLAQRPSIGGPVAQQMWNLGNRLPTDAPGIANLFRAAMIARMNDEQQSPPNQ